MISRIGRGVLMAVALAVWAGPAGATVFRTGGSVTIGAEEVINDDLIVAAQNVVVEGTVRGDLMAAANAVRVPGRVDGSVVALAQTVSVPGSVGGSVRAATQNVTLSGQVARNTALASQVASIEPTARVGRDLHAAAQTVNLDGSVGGQAALAATTARVAGQVGRNLRFEGRNLSLASNSRVGGDLVVRANTRPQIASGAVIAGEVQRLPVEQARRGRPRGVGIGFGLTGNLLTAMALFVVGAIGLALAPRFLRTAAGMLGERPGWSVLWGFLLLIVVPIAAFLVSLTVLGIPLGLLAGALWFFAVLFSAIPVALFLGRWLTAWLRRGEPLNPYANLAIGLFVLAVLGSIPFLGGLVRFAVVLFGVGVFALAAYQQIEQRRREAGGAAPSTAPAGGAPEPA
jgi:cytoskeletal protein CcmA (bactofilin family)